LILTFALKSRFDEGSLVRGEDLHAHDALEHGDLSKQLLADGQREAEAPALWIAVLGGGIVLEAGEALMEPEKRGKVLVGGLADEVEHGVIALDEGAGPAAEAAEVSVAIEVEEVGGLKAMSWRLEAQEVPDVASTPASYGGDDLEGVWALFVKPGAMSALSATATGSVQALIAGFGLTEAQANQDSRLGRVNVLAEPGLGGADLKITGAPAELRVRWGKTLCEHLGEEAPLRLRGDVNRVQVKGMRSSEGGSALGEAGVGIEHSWVLDARIGMDEDDLFDKIGVLGSKQQGDGRCCGGVFAAGAHDGPDASALFKQAGEGEVSVFDPILKLRSHRSRVYLIDKPLSSAGEGTKITAER
jgi:hypothetical protein